MTLADYLADAEHLIPPWEVIALVHRWQDRTGFRVKAQSAGRIQRVTMHRRLKVVDVATVEEESA